MIVEKLQMVVGASFLPSERGEDAHLFYQRTQTIIVFDGHWKLVEYSAFALKNQPKYDVNPKQVLLEAHSRTTEKGSSTACVITLRGNKLQYANVGDSEFMVFRDSKRCEFQSEQRQKGFNHPYQLQNRDYVNVLSLVNEGEVDVEAGDLFVAGTDGLLDNMFVSEIEKILQKTEGRMLFPEQLAWKIASTAYFNFIDEKYESPFTKASKVAGFQRSVGLVAEIGEEY